MTTPLRTAAAALVARLRQMYLRNETERLTDALAAALSTAQDERAERLEAAIRWALGETDDFPPRADGQGKYWWRLELRRRAGIEWLPSPPTPEPERPAPSTERREAP